MHSRQVTQWTGDESVKTDDGIIIQIDSQVTAWVAKQYIVTYL